MAYTGITGKTLALAVPFQRNAYNPRIFDYLRVQAGILHDGIYQIYRRCRSDKLACPYNGNRRSRIVLYCMV